MFLECDELAIKKDDWELATQGNEETINKLRWKFKGIFLYTHALSVDNDKNEYVCITAREFNRVVMADRMTLKIGVD